MHTSPHHIFLPRRLGKSSTPVPQFAYLADKLSMRVAQMPNNCVRPKASGRIPGFIWNPSMANRFLDETPTGHDFWALSNWCSSNEEIHCFQSIRSVGLAQPTSKLFLDMIRPLGTRTIRKKTFFYQNHYSHLDY